VDRLTRRADALAEHPLTGRVVEQYQRDDIREVYEGRYRMIYRVLPDRSRDPNRTRFVCFMRLSSD
jgi:plasmid stabilization system protein ParE